jgi:hypothetical protein
MTLRKTLRILIAIHAGIGLAACGGSAAPTLASGDGGSPSANGTVEGSGDAAPSPVDGGTDASVGKDATPDATPSEAPIDPIVVGHKWTYDITEIGYYPLCPSGTGDADVLGASTRDGRQAYEVRSFCKAVGSVYYAEDGDVVYWDYAGTWLLALDSPVQEGHTWTNGITSYAWHDAGTVTVPAGTFSNCWRAQDVLGPTHIVLCRGVGPVQWSYRDALGNGYDAALTGKNF